MNSSQLPTLRASLQKLSRRWALIGFAVTTLLGTPCILYSAKLASERQLLIVAKSAARAFRPMIVEEQLYRDAQAQMQTALELKAGESAVIRDSHLKAFYLMDEKDKQARCESPGRFCWDQGFRRISILYPIYFDETKKDELFGYLEVTLKPTLDLTIVSTLVVLLLIVFTALAYGLSSALEQSTRLFIEPIRAWADHLKRSPATSAVSASASAPYAELKPMEEAVSGLHLEIERLRASAAKEAKAVAQFDILQEIGHDLRTPHSQLAKQFELLVDTVQTRGALDPQEVQDTKRTIRRMGDLIRQVRVFQEIQKGKLTEADGRVNLEEETRVILSDLKSDPEANEKGISIEWQSKAGMSPARMSKIGYYRILENLIRNAIHAAKPGMGKIIVTLDTKNGLPTLAVKDNGAGIPSDIQSRIFDFDFTTKPTRGTGLGLGIVSKICAEAGATIQFQSTVDSGTEFTVSFVPLQSRNLEPNSRELNSEVFHG